MTDQTVNIRKEHAGDIETITRLTEAAFRDQVFSSHTEQFIVNALRRSGQLTVSLVATSVADLVGHVAISPVTISSGATGWYGLGPISVWPERQREGIGSRLIESALSELQALGGRGVVLLGEPEFYRRFGFRVCNELELPGVPREYFQALSFGEKIPEGRVSYHAAFEAVE